MLFGFATFGGLMMERYAENFGAKDFPVIFRISEMEVPGLVDVERVALLFENGGIPFGPIVIHLEAQI
jgi:hypothetical protein